MKIAWISYDFLEYSALHINEMAKEHEVLAILPEPTCDDESYSLNVRDTNAPIGDQSESARDGSNEVEQFLFDKPRLRQPILQLRSTRSILKKLFEFKPDVVHFQQAHLWFNFSLAKIQKHFPLVVTIHDPQHHSGDAVSKKTPQWVVNHGFRKADHVIVHGNKLVDQVCRLFGLTPERTHVIPHVAMGNMSNQGQIDHSKTESNSILFFGRIWDYKGLKYLIDAEPMISAQCPDAKIIIAGEGDDFQKYLEQIQNPERFEIHNRWITDEERSEFFSRAGMVVLPYTDATQSGVVPVAYNFGKPVVATDVGALSDCVMENETGFLVEPRSPKSLAQAIVKLLKDPVQAKNMGAAGRNWVSVECSPATVAKRHVEAYQNAIAYRANHENLPEETLRSLGTGSRAAFVSKGQN